MLKDWATFGAGLKVLSPACAAVMVHEPAPVIWTELPLTVQFPEATKLTARLELAEALTAKSASPNILLASAPNVIV